MSTWSKSQTWIFMTHSIRCFCCHVFSPDASTWPQLRLLAHERPSGKVVPYCDLTADDMRKWTIMLKSTHYSEPAGFNSFSLHKYFIHSGIKKTSNTPKEKETFNCAETVSRPKDMWNHKFVCFWVHDIICFRLNLNLQKQEHNIKNLTIVSQSFLKCWDELSCVCDPGPSSTSSPSIYVCGVRACPREVPAKHQ